MAHRIAVIGGDGVGPELVEQALRVLAAVADLEDFTYETVELPNSAEHYRATGVTVNQETFDTLRGCDSLLFGAAGVDEFPGLMERALVLDVSRELGPCVGVCPAYLHAERLTPLKCVGRGGIDCVIVRDTTEGELAIRGGSLQLGSPYEATASLVMHTRRGVERTLRYSFDLARERRRKLSLVIQSNALGAHADRVRRDIDLVLASDRVPNLTARSGIGTRAQNGPRPRGPGRLSRDVLSAAGPSPRGRPACQGGADRLDSMTEERARTPIRRIR